MFMQMALDLIILKRVIYAEIVIITIKSSWSKW